MNATKTLHKVPHPTSMEMASAASPGAAPQPPAEATAQRASSAPAADAVAGGRYRLRFACSTPDVENPARGAAR